MVYSPWLFGPWSMVYSLKPSTIYLIDMDYRLIDHGLLTD